MTVADERVELFTYLARLLIYLTSGKSHVGHLLNYAENPIHELVLVLQMHSNIRETLKLTTCPHKVNIPSQSLMTGHNQIREIWIHTVLNRR
jgi:hypothetical protein